MSGYAMLIVLCRVNWAQRNVGKRLRPKDPTESLRTAQIHISYISRQTDAVISESSLRSLFSQFGEVVDVTIKKSQFDPVSTTFKVYLLLISYLQLFIFSAFVCRMGMVLCTIR